MPDLPPLLGLLILLACCVIYLLPLYLARKRQVVHRGGILILNLFLGWTGFGWIGAMIWACTAETAFQARLREFQEAQMDAAEPAREVAQSGSLLFGRAVGAVMRRGSADGKRLHTTGALPESSFPAECADRPGPIEGK